jgi:hypothetical protein
MWKWQTRLGRRDLRESPDAYGPHSVQVQQVSVDGHRSNVPVSVKDSNDASPP